MNQHRPHIVCIIGPTASGKSARAVEFALAQNGEVISVDSRQVYRGLDIGTEKITPDEMRGIPHHLIDIREPNDSYSAADFVQDAKRLIEEITARGKLPVLVGGTHYYFDALLFGIPEIKPNELLRKEFEKLSNEELFARIQKKDPRRAGMLDPQNRRRLIRALEIIEEHGTVPERVLFEAEDFPYEIEWQSIDLPSDELRTRIDQRLQGAFDRGLMDEVRRVREQIGDARLNELGLEYRIIGEYLRGEQSEESVLPALSSKLWQYARRQKAWIRKLRDSLDLAAAFISPPVPTAAMAPPPDRN